MEVSGRHPGCDFTIRRAVANDYATLVELWQRAGIKLEVSGRESEEAFCAQLRFFPHLYLVAEASGQIVGVVLGTHDHRKGWISRLAVDPDHRRKGIATALVTACERAIRGDGIQVVSALVEEDNAASAALFERLGFHTLEVRYFRKTDGDAVQH